jgi:hypothetical protein
MQEHTERVRRAVTEREASLDELEINLRHAVDDLALLPVDKHSARVRSHLLQSLRLVAKLRRAEPKLRQSA